MSQEAGGRRQEEGGRIRDVTFLHSAVNDEYIVDIDDEGELVVVRDVLDIDPLQLCGHLGEPGPLVAGGHARVVHPPPVLGQEVRE